MFKDFVETERKDCYFLFRNADVKARFLDEHVWCHTTVLMYCIINGVPDAVEWKNARLAFAARQADKYGLKLAKETESEAYFM